MPEILQILSKSMQAKNCNVNKDNEAVTCTMPVNVEEVFECQLHLEYRRSNRKISSSSPRTLVEYLANLFFETTLELKLRFY